MLAGTLSKPPSTVAELLPPDLAARVEALDLLSRKVLTGKLQGERRSKRRGRSVEFDDYREYSLGDDLRHIDWNVLARLDRFFIKVFQEEEDLALHIVLDASASMNAGEPEAANKLLFATRLAAAMGAVGLANNNRVLVSIMAPSGLKRLEPLRARRSSERLCRFLLDHAFEAATLVGSTPQAEPATFTRAMRTLAADPAGKGVMLILSDMFVQGDGYEPGLKILAASGSSARAGSASGMDIYILQTLAPSELDPLAGRANRLDNPLAGDLRFTDVESGRATEVTVTPELVEFYKRALRRGIDDLHAFASARGMVHQLVTTDTDPGELITGTLRRLGMLK